MAEVPVDQCAYVYPGNHRRCGRDRDSHGVPAMGWANRTADGHAFVQSFVYIATVDGGPLRVEEATGATNELEAD